MNQTFLAVLLIVSTMFIGAAVASEQPAWEYYPDEPEWVYTSDNELGYNFVTGEFVKYDWNLDIAMPEPCLSVTYVGDDEYVYCDDLGPKSLDGFYELIKKHL